MNLIPETDRIFRFEEAGEVLRPWPIHPAGQANQERSQARAESCGRRRFTPQEQCRLWIKAATRQLGLGGDENMLNRVIDRQALEHFWP